MRIAIIFFLLFPFFARADVDPHFSESEDLTTCHHVNVISGHINLCFQDVEVQAGPGIAPITLVRTYSSAGALYENDHRLTDIYRHPLVQGGWNAMPHLKLLVESREDGPTRFFLCEKSGQLITYCFAHYEDDRNREIFKPEIKGGQCSGSLSGRSNPQNNFVSYFPHRKEAVLYLPDGGRRIYTTKSDFNSIRELTLQTEIAPNQHRTIYYYNEQGQVCFITTLNPQGTKTFSALDLKVTNLGTRHPRYLVDINTSDGKQIHYEAIHHEGRQYLNHIWGNCKPDESLHFIPGRKKIGARIHSVTLDGKMHFRVHYYEPPDKKQAEKWLWDPSKRPLYGDRVRMIEGPMGPNGEFIPIAHFTYNETFTDVRDVENILTRYIHDGNRLNSIEYFDEHDHLHSKLLFTWEENRLKSKTYFYGSQEPLFSKTFQYDTAGNVVEEVLKGNLTGDGTETFTRRFAYFPRLNLPQMEEEEGGLIYIYFYKGETDLMTARFVCIREKILMRNFYDYNEDNLLITEVIDDGCRTEGDSLEGVTQRQILHHKTNDCGQRTETTEAYLDLETGQERTIKKIAYSYTQRKQCCDEMVYDAEGIYRYTLHTDYDNYGRVISKTTPLGQQNTYRYDESGNLLEVKEAGQPKKTYTYHPSGTPTSCTEGEDKTTFTHYDAKGRLISKTDHRGNTSYQTYDEFGRCLTTQFAEIKNQREETYLPQVDFTYDAQGNLSSTTTPDRITTHTLYNALKKPILITYADGSTLTHRYHKNGTLAKTIYPDGTRVLYNYDVFQRLTEKSVFSKEGELLASESWEFNAFHLLQHTNARGLKTTYTYDFAGSKIAETAEDRVIRFSYDALGFLEKTSYANSMEVRLNDVAGRVIEQWTEDPSGVIENRIQFFYDEENRKTKATRLTQQGVATDYFSYDFEGKLIRHENAMGNVTEWIYNETHRNELGQCVLQKITIDPLRNQTIETHDALGHVVQLEHKDPQNHTVSLEDYYYDLSGNKAKRKTTIYRGIRPHKTIETLWEYDCFGNVIKEIESGQKITTYAYDEKRRVKTTTLPNGTQFCYSYDDIDRMVAQTSSDESIDYQYFYEKGPEPTLILDRRDGSKLERSYNLFGELIQETNPLGLSYYWEYDHCGRCTQFILPEGSSIAYQYSGGHLISVQRKTPQGLLLYEHSYSAFDPNGKVTQEELIQGLGTIQTEYDLLERPSKQASAWAEYAVNYGPSGLVKTRQHSLIGDKSYLYDALNQLIRESEEYYPVDSLGNPINAEVDDCNQILATPDATFAYDGNGNPLSESKSEGTEHYTYDALSRLTKIQSNGPQVNYRYDPLGRLLSKETYTGSERHYQVYLYDQNMEIGTLSETGQIQQLKVLGRTLKADIGAAVAIEIDEQIFAPLHDFGGNIIAIISSNGRIAETYAMNAFGKDSSDTTPINPWRFCSKRSEQNFVFFGKRFYNLSLRRWHTPDPAGFVDGANLYLYVLNSPLNRLDLFGLETIDGFWLEEENDPLARKRFDRNEGVNIDTFPSKLLESPGDVLSCKGSIGGVEVDWVISFNSWHKLQFTPEELSNDRVNIFDHVHEILPKEGVIIGLITAQNGINNKRREFKKMSESIVNKIPEGPLFIGLYNPTEGLFGDLKRFRKEKRNIDTPIVCVTSQFMSAMAEQIHSVNPDLLWLHVAHSEGGLIRNRAIERMDPDHRSLLSQHLISLSIGPAAPCSKDTAFQAVNIYSKKDYVTKRFAKPFLNDTNYDIRFVDCVTPIKDRILFFADHGMMKRTYQKELDLFVDHSRKNIGFYNATQP